MKWCWYLIFESMITLSWPYTNKSYLNALEIGASLRKTSCKSEWKEVNSALEASVPNGIVKMNQMPVLQNFNSWHFPLAFN